METSFCAVLLAVSKKKATHFMQLVLHGKVVFYIDLQIPKFYMH